jgi:predicted nucleotidyltransferase
VGQQGIKRLASQREAILQIASEYGGTNVRIFGSVVRGEDEPDSDIDILVDLKPGRSLLDLAGIKVDLVFRLRKRIRPWPPG